MKNMKQKTPMIAIKYNVLTICPSATCSSAQSEKIETNQHGDRQLSAMGGCSNGPSTASMQPPLYYTQPKVPYVPLTWLFNVMMPGPVTGGGGGGGAGGGGDSRVGAVAMLAECRRALRDSKLARGTALTVRGPAPCA
jgi:hypothetical protein